jgi:hypothetical protein
MHFFAGLERLNARVLHTGSRDYSTVRLLTWLTSIGEDDVMPIPGMDCQHA